MKSNFALKASFAAVALALSTSASAFTLVQIQFNGGGGFPGSVVADKLDAEPGNILFENISPIPVFPAAGTPINVLGQGTATWKLGAASINPAGIEITYVFGVPASAVVGSSFGTTDSIFHLATAGGGYFEVYIAPSGTSNALAGTGFNTGTLLFSGVFKPQGTLGSFTLTTAGPLVDLDQFGVDNYVGVDTEAISGSTSYVIDVTYQNPLYIINDISTFAVGGADSNINTSTLTPFDAVDPSATFQNVTNTGPIAGGVNYGGDGDNNNSCGAGPSPCDIHVQGDANMTFTTGPVIPEPASLALLGLGIGAMGLLGRRRRGLKVA